MEGELHLAAAHNICRQSDVTIGANENDVTWELRDQ